MVKKSKKRIAYIKPLLNHVELNVLEPFLIEKYKFVPQVLLALGVSDFYNLIHRTTQRAIQEELSENEAKEFTTDVLNSVIGQILAVAALAEYKVDEPGLVVPEEELEAKLLFEIDRKDAEFLTKHKIDPRSLL